jgi:hypothetical protein
MWSMQDDDSLLERKKTEVSLNTAVPFFKQNNITVLPSNRVLDRKPDRVTGYKILIDLTSLICIGRDVGGVCACSFKTSTNTTNISPYTYTLYMTLVAWYSFSDWFTFRTRTNTTNISPYAYILSSCTMYMHRERFWWCLCLF